MRRSVRKPLLILVVVAVLILVALPSLPFEAHWPWFGTREMRSAAEEVLPPSPDLTFTDAWIRRNLEPSPHEECVAYHTSTNPDEVIAYYRNRFQELHWALRYDNGPDPRHGNYDYFLEGVLDGPSVLLYADSTSDSLNPSVPTAGATYTVQLCTLASWSDAKRVLRPTNS